MKINIVGHHLEITDSLRQYVTDKLERINRHCDQVMEVSVILQVDKLEQKAEATIHVSGATLFAQHDHEDMYAAVDGLVDKLDRQLVRHKEKTQGH
ncbi:MAG: ribosome hibernation-promoting factor, HPF/YfiA family [Methylococcaceae bacterium]